MLAGGKLWNYPSAGSMHKTFSKDNAASQFTLTADDGRGRVVTARLDGQQKPDLYFPFIALFQGGDLTLFQRIK
jgi:hypothetical protein